MNAVSAGQPLRGSPVCEKCFRQWDFVPDTSLPYSGALKAVHPVGPCVERVAAPDIRGSFVERGVCRECGGEFEHTSDRKRWFCRRPKCLKIRAGKQREKRRKQQAERRKENHPLYLEKLRRARAKRNTQIERWRAYWRDKDKEKRDRRKSA